MPTTSATRGRIFIKCNLTYKEFHALSDGNIISLKRQFNNFDRRYTQPVNAIVIDSEIIPQGAEILMHHNGVHGTYQIFDYKELGADYISDTTKYFSIPEDQCYAWRIGNGEWNPAPGFEFGLRIFKPYIGPLSGILPTQIKNKLLITSGEYCGKAVMTKGNCDYEIIFNNEKGREQRLIRLRHFPNEEAHIREEIVAIDHETTNKIESGEYLIGLSASLANPINILA